MSPRNYPPLSPREVIRILTARGFYLTNTRGSHSHYICTRNGKRYKVTVDAGIKQFGPDLIKSMIRQSGMSKKEFFCSTKKTAKKIGERVVKKSELDAWNATIE